MAQAVGSIRQAGRRPGLAVQQLGLLARLHWRALLVLVAFLLAVWVIPTMTPVPVSDDWFYARSVQHLLEQHRLDLTGASASLVFQVLWGGLFAAIFGFSFGILRVSAIVLVFLSGLAFYGLCRELAIDRHRSALGLAAYIFSPLAFVLTFTFMSDPNFMALLTIAAFLYVKGCRQQTANPVYLLAAGVVSALALLVRQQGVLVPMGVASYLLVSRRIGPNLRGLRLMSLVLGPMALAFVLYYGWLHFFYGMPASQAGFAQAAIATATVPGAAILLALVAIQLMYVGCFSLPLSAAGLVALPRLWDRLTRARRAWYVLSAGILLALLVLLGLLGMRMPYVPHFLNRAGLGPNDLVVSRPELLSQAARQWLTIACGASVLLFGLVLLGARRDECRQGRPAAGVLLGIAAWQVVGIWIPSSNFRYWHVDGVWPPSLDRYLLPLLPLVIALFLWGMANVRLVLPLAWLATLVLGLYAVAGTRDSLVFHGATWQLARVANARGIANVHLDAGATWDGYHLLDTWLGQSIAMQTPGYEVRVDDPAALLTPTPPWWIHEWARVDDSQYVIAGEPILGFTIVDHLDYSSWLQQVLRGKQTALYLMRRPGVVGPP